MDILKKEQKEKFKFGDFVKVTGRASYDGSTEARDGGWIGIVDESADAEGDVGVNFPDEFFFFKEKDLQLIERPEVLQDIPGSTETEITITLTETEMQIITAALGDCTHNEINDSLRRNGYPLMSRDFESQGIYAQFRDFLKGDK